MLFLCYSFFFMSYVVPLTQLCVSVCLSQCKLHVKLYLLRILIHKRNSSLFVALLSVYVLPHEIKATCTYLPSVQPNAKLNTPENNNNNINKNTSKCEEYSLLLLWMSSCSLVALSINQKYQIAVIVNKCCCFVCF